MCHYNFTCTKNIRGKTSSLKDFESDPFFKVVVISKQDRNYRYIIKFKEMIVVNENKNAFRGSYFPQCSSR